jgi:SWI/SNF-related matrix-associated actin-dependent regulator of chromatin subfamily A3
MPRPTKQTAPQSRASKRPVEVIDLTDDAATTRPAKSPRFPFSAYAAQLQSQWSRPSQSYSQFQSPALASSRPSFVPNSTPPTLPRASQRDLGDDDLEPSTQDLTQNDDGPQRELYGSFGMPPLAVPAQPIIIHKSPALTPDRWEDCRGSLL